MLTAMMLREARASIDLDKGGDGQTMCEMPPNATLFRRMPNGELTSERIYVPEFYSFEAAVLKETGCDSKSR